jgi:hypothetical protein
MNEKEILVMNPSAAAVELLRGAKTRRLRRFCQCKISKF